VRIDVITIFPGYLAPLREALPGKAISAGLVDLAVHDLRTWTHDVHQSVDDAPYGGGPGMVMRCEPIYAAVEDVTARFAPARRILLTPQGTPLTQAVARRLADECPSMLLFCGRYEGVDERVRALFDEELSIGDYVLTGGELGALVVIDAVARLVPGVLGSAESPAAESFSDADLLEYPQYTRPAEFRGLAVPPVLTSGNHGEIARWRGEQARLRTGARRPDLAPRPPGEASASPRRRRD